MNILKTHAVVTPQLDTFLVYWTNSAISLKGVIKVRITNQIKDLVIAAELAALQYLLEDKGVLGNQLAGSVTTKLIVSRGAIRKLQLRQSDKVHLAPYANFLTTRFAGSQMSVDQDTRWFDSLTPDSTDHLLVSGPRREKVKMTGIGEISITHHVLERFADRTLPNISEDKRYATAWKKLSELVSDPAICEVARNSLWAGLNNSAGGRQEGRYFLNERKKLIFVVTDNPTEGKKLVTTYPATRQFYPLPLAA